MTVTFASKLFIYDYSFCDEKNAQTFFFFNVHVPFLNIHTYVLTTCYFNFVCWLRRTYQNILSSKIENLGKALSCFKMFPWTMNVHIFFEKPHMTPLYSFCYLISIFIYTIIPKKPPFYFTLRLMNIYQGIIQIIFLSDVLRGFHHTFCVMSSFH